MVWWGVTSKVVLLRGTWNGLLSIWGVMLLPLAVLKLLGASCSLLLSQSFWILSTLMLSLFLLVVAKMGVGLFLKEILVCFWRLLIA